MTVGGRIQSPLVFVILLFGRHEDVDFIFWDSVLLEYRQSLIPKGGGALVAGNCYDPTA